MKLFESIFREAYADDRDAYRAAASELEAAESTHRDVWKDQSYTNSINKSSFDRVTKKIVDIFESKGFVVEASDHNFTEYEGDLAHAWHGGADQGAGFDVSKNGMTFFLKKNRDYTWQIIELMNKNDFEDANAYRGRKSQDYFSSSRVSSKREKAARLKTITDLYLEIADIEDMLEEYQIELDTELLPDIDMSSYDIAAGEARVKARELDSRVQQSYKDEMLDAGDSVRYKDSKGDTKKGTIVSIKRDKNIAKVKTEGGAVRSMSIDEITPLGYMKD